MDKEQHELLQKLGMFDQQAQAINQQLQIVDENIASLDILELGLDGLSGSVEKEILAPIGQGVFVKTKLLSEELLVDVGKKHFVKKSIPETKEIIKEQSIKLEEIKADLNLKLEEINQELTSLILEAQKDQMSEKSNKEENNTQ